MIGTGSKLSLGRKDGSATEFLLDLSGPPIAFAAYHFDPHTLLAVILLSFADARWSMAAVSRISTKADAIAGHRPTRARIGPVWQGPALAPSGSPVTRRDIIARASLARRTVTPPLSIVKIRFWLPGRFVLAGVRGASKKCWPLWGTEDSNPLPSSGESGTNRLLR